MTKSTIDHQFALCIKSDDCEDLEKRKVYEIIPDKDAAKDGYVRIVDESGEDYLYPRSCSPAESYAARCVVVERSLSSTRLRGSCDPTDGHL